MSVPTVKFMAALPDAHRRLAPDLIVHTSAAAEAA
jgi:hypothetical protein